MREKELRSLIKFTPQGWGFSKTITSSDKHLGLLWFVAKDGKCPIHYHKIQDRTIYIHSGKIKMFYSDNLAEIQQNISATGPHGVYKYMESVTLNKGDNFYIPPGVVTRVIASEDSEIYIFSSAPISGDYFELVKGD